MPRLAVYLQRARAVRVEAGDDFDQGGLAGAVVTEDAGHLAGVHRQVDALQGGDGTVALAHALHLDQGLALVQVGGGVLHDRVGHVTSSARRSS